MAEEARYSLSFTAMTQQLMEERGITILQLADSTGLSRDTVKNMRTRDDIVFRIRDVLAVCIALHLTPRMSETYLEKSPCKLLETEEMGCYRLALERWYTCGVPEVNRRLQALGVRPLTDLLYDPILPGRKRL